MLIDLTSVTIMSFEPGYNYLHLCCNLCSCWVSSYTFVVLLETVMLLPHLNYTYCVSKKKMCFFYDYSTFLYNLIPICQLKHI